MERYFREKKRVSASCSYSKKTRGFSLVELMIAMAVGLVVLGAAYGIFTSQNKTLKAQEQIVELQQNVRAAMGMITRDVRRAGYNPQRATFSGLTVGATQIEIRADFDGNGSTNGTNEYIVYAYDSTNMKITKKIGDGAPQPVAENIEAFTVTTLSASTVRVSIRGRTSLRDTSYSSNGGYRTYTMTSDINARNLAL